MTSDVRVLRPFLLRFAEPLLPSGGLEGSGSHLHPDLGSARGRSAAGSGAEGPNIGTRITRTDQESTDDE